MMTKTIMGNEEFAEEKAIKKAEMANFSKESLLDIYSSYAIAFALTTDEGEKNDIVVYLSALEELILERMN